MQVIHCMQYCTVYPGLQKHGFWQPHTRQHTFIYMYYLISFATNPNICTLFNVISLTPVMAEYARSSLDC